MFSKIFANTSSNVFKFAVMMVVTFIMTPVYVRELGNYDYGIWELVLSVFGYLGLVNLGLIPTISRFTAMFRGGRDLQNGSALFSTSVVLMSAAGLFVASALLAWSLVAPDALAGEGSSSDRYALLLQLLALQATLSLPTAALESTLEGQQQYSLKNNLDLAHTLVAATVLYHAMPLYDPLLLLAGMNVATATSKLVILFTLLARPRYGNNRFSARRFSGDLAMRMYRFGMKSAVQGIASRIGQRADILIIGAFIGPQVIVFYSIPQALVLRAQAFTQILTHALMPAFSELHGAGESERLKRIFMDASRMVVAVLCGVALGIILLGPRFIDLWIGPEYGEPSREILWLLTGTTLLWSLLPAANRFMTAIDRHGILAKIAVASVVINLALSLSLVQWLGAKGVALASTLGALCLAPFIWSVTLRNLGVTVGTYSRQVLLPAALTCLPMAATLLIFDRWGSTPGWQGFMQSAFASASVFGVSFLFCGLTRTERATMVALLKRGMQRARVRT